MSRAAIIALTAAEADAVNWAFGAMSDYWNAACEPGSTPDPDAEGVTENDLAVPVGAQMPFLSWGAKAGSGAALTLSTWEEVNDDLLYRIGQQLPDMADDAKSIGGDFTPQAAGRTVGMCNRLAAKLREAGA
jgi:hypothetical protein